MAAVLVGLRREASTQVNPEKAKSESRAPRTLSSYLQTLDPERDGAGAGAGTRMELGRGQGWGWRRSRPELTLEQGLRLTLVLNLVGGCPGEQT